MGIQSSEVFIGILNGVIKESVKPDFDENVVSLEQKLIELGIDSLDTALIYVHLTEIYGISAEVTDKKWSTNALQDLYDFIMQHKTRDFLTPDEALEHIR